MRLHLFLGLLSGAAALAACALPPPVTRASAPPELAPAPAAPPPQPQALAACARLSPGTGARPAGAQRQGSTVALVELAGRALAYAADEDGRALHTFDLDARAPIAVTPLDGAPSQILVLADGRVAVALADKNRVAILEPSPDPASPLALRCSAATPVEPLALAVTPGEERLLVASGWGHALTALGTASLAPELIVDLPREPRAVLVADDGRAFVSHAIGGVVSIVDLGAARASTVGLAFELIQLWGNEPRTASQGFALARGRAGRVFAPMISVNPGSGVHSSELYGPLQGIPVVPVVAVLDERTGDPLSRKIAGEVDRDLYGIDALWSVGGTPRACMLPRAAAMGSPATLLVACQGADVLLELDARARDPMQVERRRFALPAGPTGVAVDEARRRAIVWSAFAHTLAALDLVEAPGARPFSRSMLPDILGTAGSRPRPALAPAFTIAAAPLPGWPEPRVARGRILFHATGDGLISSDGRACATCHPAGRDDGLTWSTPTGMHQTMMLAGRVASSAPYGWLGARSTLEAHISDTFHRLGGRGVFGDADRREASALAAYVASLRGPSREDALGLPAPALVARGRAIFEDPRHDCAGCHPLGGTDRAMHDVRSGAVPGQRFDTPSLRFVGGTPPYFHDGRYATLDELLAKSDGKMGHTADLSPDDVRAVRAYLEAL